MAIFGPPVPKRIEIQQLKKVTSWVLWTPFIISLIAILLFALVRFLIRFSHNDIHLKRWIGFRDWLAMVTSGGEFVGVYSHQSNGQATSHRVVQREPAIVVEGMTIINIDTQQSDVNETEWNVNREKDLFMVDRRIPAKAKGSWFNIYLLLLPLQVAFITMIIVHNIYIEEYHTESCDSFGTIVNDSNQSLYYDCRYNQLSKPNNVILEICNETEHSSEPISCTNYVYNPLLSSVILTILNSLLLHLTLAKVIVRFVIVMRYIVHKYGKSCREKCPHNIHGAFIVCNVFLLIVGVISILYIVIVDAKLGSDLTTDIVLFAFVVIGVSIALFQFGLLQTKLYTPFDKCSFNVTDDPKARDDDQTTNINQTQKPIENYFCCSSTTTNARENYEQIQ